MLTRLRELRNEMGISQQKLAEALMISQPSINKYENHNVEPEIAILKQMAEYFHTTIDYLVGQSDERQPLERTLPYHLTEDERQVIEMYRMLSEDAKTSVRGVLYFYTQPERGKSVAIRQKSQSSLNI